MKSSTTTDAEQRILEAAGRVFLRRGFDGARMQDIADEAGVDKALVHYYYRSKDKLFALVFSEVTGKFLAQLRSVLLSDLSLTEKIGRLVHQDSAMPNEYPLVAQFIISEMNQSQHRENEPLLVKPLHELQTLFVQQVEATIQEGSIRQVDAIQLFVSFISLSLFPLIAKPLLKAILDLDDAGYSTLLTRRANELPDFINQALVP